MRLKYCILIFFSCLVFDLIKSQSDNQSEDDNFSTKSGATSVILSALDGLTVKVSDVKDKLSAM